MRGRSLSLIVATALAASARAGSMESLKSGAALGIGSAGIEAGVLLKKGAVAPLTAEERRAAEPAVPPEELTLDQMLDDPRIEELPRDAGMGGLLGSFQLADRLDTHSDLFTLKLGDKVWDVSIAADPPFENGYIAFRREGSVVLSKVQNINDLRGKGVVVRIDDKTAYRFKVSINIFNPIRGSTLKVDPVNGTQGPNHKIKTGKILDRMKEESYVFKAGGNEYWALYGTDVDPKTGELGGTRSLLFVRENGTETKAWPVAESALEPGKPVAVTFGETRVVLFRTSEGELRLHDWTNDLAATAKVF